LLVKLGANIETGEEPPLWVATSLGLYSIVEFLVSNGANIATISTHNGKRLLPKEVAQDRGHEEVVRFLQFTECVHAILEGDNFPVIKKSIEEQPLLASKIDNNGNTLLHHAAKNGRLSILEYLLINTLSDKEAVNNIGRTPLFCAASKGKLECIKLLIANGANIEKCDRNGCSPLWKAASLGHFQVVKSLILQGALVRTKGTHCDGKTYFPAQIAAKKGHHRLAATLIEGKIESNEMDLQRTPLLNALRTKLAVGKDIKRSVSSEISRV